MYQPQSAPSINFYLQCGVHRTSSKELHLASTKEQSTHPFISIHIKRLRNPSGFIGAHQLLVQPRVVPPQRKAQNRSHGQEPSIDPMAQAIEWRILRAIDPDANDLTGPCKCNVKSRG